MLHKIKIYIDNFKIEDAYNSIIESEPNMINSDCYWQLRGELCELIGEYATAKKCYIKANEINDCNKAVIEKLMNIALKDKEKESVEKYRSQIKELESLINKSLIKSLVDNHKHVDKTEINKILLNFDNYTYYYNQNFLHNKTNYIHLDMISKSLKENLVVFVPYDVNYVESVKEIADRDIFKCKILLVIEGKIQFVNVPESVMKSLKDNNYKKTITINKLSASDSNIHALIEYMPTEYKEKYKINLIKGWDVLSIENKVLVPLKSVMTISGFGLFLGYPIPKLTYNLEVGHGAMTFKALGNMAKKNKNFAFTPAQYNNVDKVCVTSDIDMITQAAATAQQEDKFLITGMPRTDTLINTDGRTNLEKLLKIKLGEKKVIINMPTFHKHDGCGMIQGDEQLNNYMKIKDFDYRRFDKFLEKNDMICIMKVHHAEASSVKSNRIKDKMKNTYFIENNDLEKLNLDLYEIIGGTDILITDYSSIYSDFIFMNKPVVFTNVDIDAYREDIGLMLEPYDFWTAGPKVREQDSLERELVNSKDINYYKEKRDQLRPVFFKDLNGRATQRIWSHINEIMEDR